MFLWSEIAGFFSRLARHAAQPGMCCISFDASGVYSAYVILSVEGLPQLQWCEFTPYVESGNLAKTLAVLVEQKHLQNVNCSWVLQKNDYKLLTIEALPVKPEELSAAARWRIKDLINFPVEQALVQVFPAPFSLVFGKPNNLQVVAAEAAYLQTTAEIIQNSGLNLSIIDIPELTLRNITALFKEDAEGLGVLWLGTAYSKLLITQKNNMYLTRDFNLVLTTIFNAENATLLTLAAQNQLETLATEIQRSLDYYQSQLKQPPPAKLLIAFMPPLALNFLSTLLTVPLEPLNFAGLLNGNITLSTELQSRCLAVMGGALRKDAAL